MVADSHATRMETEEEAKLFGPSAVFKLSYAAPLSDLGALQEDCETVNLVPASRRDTVRLGPNLGREFMRWVRREEAGGALLA